MKDIFLTDYYLVNYNYYYYTFQGCTNFGWNDILIVTKYISLVLLSSKLPMDPCLWKKVLYSLLGVSYGLSPVPLTPGFRMYSAIWLRPFCSWTVHYPHGPVSMWLCQASSAPSLCKASRCCYVEFFRWEPCVILSVVFRDTSYSRKKQIEHLFTSGSYHEAGPLS